MFLFLSSKMIDMELSDIRPLIEFYHSKLSQVSLDFKRYLYNKINWKARIIGIRGERGVGKTTMLIQRIKEKYTNPDDTIYISLDHLWFKTHSLQELIGFLYNRGINEFYIDEVHKNEDWSRIIKNLYDQYADDRQDDAYADPLEPEHTRVNIRVLKALGGVVLLAALEEP